tara:strand:- start:377 stop:682 length:306 start_codon:yes stop_codon:yes gene_type:complete
MSKEKLIKYIQENYGSVVVEAEGGPYIEIDLIPNGNDDAVYTLVEAFDECQKNDLDTSMLTRSYTTNEADGLRENRYWYFMQETTKIIMRDYNINQIINEV